MTAPDSNCCASLIVENLRRRAESLLVTDVRIGLGYTAVMLENGAMGLAYTFHKKAPKGCAVFQGTRPLAGKPASALLGLTKSLDLVEAAVGLACANALANTSCPGGHKGDILDHLVINPDDRVGMVGHFGPLVDPLRERVGNLTIFEWIDKPAGFLLPQKEALHILPQCQIAIISATTIINGTIDQLLQAASNCRELILLGASTPLLAEVFEPKGVTMLSGLIAQKQRAILQVVSEGGGMRQFKNYAQKVCIRTV